MIASHRYHGEQSPASPSSAFLHRTENEKNRSFGKKAFLLFLFATSVCIGAASVKGRGDLRSAIEIITTSTDKDDGINKSESVNGNTDTTTPTNNNIGFGSVATASAGATVLKECGPEHSEDHECDQGERCIKLAIETTTDEEEIYYAHPQHPTRIKKGPNDDFVVNDNERKEREAWYCIPESYSSGSMSSSIPMNIYEVR